jgi:hypothetical protein
VLFTDTDVALIRDPFPYLLWKDVDYVHSLNVICSNEDHWDFRNTPKEEGNTGFYYVKSNPRTIKLWQRAYEAVPKYPGLDDQAVFWRVIRQSTDPEIVPLGVCRDFDPASSDSKGSRLLGEGEEKEGGEKDKDKEAAIPLVTCRLDPCVFSSGMLSRVWIPEYTYEALVDNVALRNETICALHANYLSGNTPKMQRMQEYGFWLASKREMIGLENDGSSKAAHHHHHHAKHHESEDWGGKCSDFVLRKVTTEEHESNQVRRKLRHLSRN